MGMHPCIELVAEVDTDILQHCHPESTEDDYFIEVGKQYLTVWRHDDNYLYEICLDIPPTRCIVMMNLTSGHGDCISFEALEAARMRLASWLFNHNIDYQMYLTSTYS